MKHYATFDKFNIGFDETLRKFFILSKEDGDKRPQIGGFDLPAQAIDFAIKRVS